MGEREGSYIQPEKSVERLVGGEGRHLRSVKEAPEGGAGEYSRENARPKSRAWGERRQGAGRGDQERGPGAIPLGQRQRAFYFMSLTDTLARNF